MAIHKGKIFIDVVLMYTKPFTGGSFAVFDVVLKGWKIREQAGDVLTWRLSKQSLNGGSSFQSRISAGRLF